MLSARTVRQAPTDADPFFPRVIEGLLSAPGYDEMMAIAALFSGYDIAAEIGGEEESPTLWDEVMDIRLSCL